MNVLIIDNGTKHIADIMALLPNHNVNVRMFDTVSLDESEQADCIILTGGGLYPVAGNEHYFETEMQVIKQTSTPLLGICLGFELIAFTYGAGLEKMETKVEALENLQVVQNDFIFNSKEQYRVFTSRRWLISEVPHPLITLARSELSVQVIKHQARLVYGFQFHPELCLDKSNGSILFKNILKLISLHHESKIDTN